MTSEGRTPSPWTCPKCGPGFVVTPDEAATHQRLCDDGIRDTLIDCMTSFGCHGDTAAEAADYILSEYSGLTVTVTP